MRELLILEIARKVCHCEGHIWLPRPNPAREAAQARYINTARGILELVEQRVSEHIPVGALAYAPPHVRNGDTQ